MKQSIKAVLSHCLWGPEGSRIETLIAKSAKSRDLKNGEPTVLPGIQGLLLNVADFYIRTSYKEHHQ